MKIIRMQANHLINPVGYSMNPLSLSYVVGETDAKRQTAARIEISETEAFDAVVYDSGRTEQVVSTGFAVPFEPKAEMRYYWRVTVWTDNGDTAVSDIAYFETAKAGGWSAKWITPVADKSVQVSVEKTFTVNKAVKSARLYGVGLGVYELYLNGEKQGDEVLMPGFCSYDAYIPYQTYPLELRQGENKVSMMLGDGWYKGIFGLRILEENYGDRLACIAELHITYEDGTREVIATDETWIARKSPVVCSGIYPGETYDPAVEQDTVYAMEEIALDKAKLEARIDPPLKVIEKIRPIEVITTPRGETVLDMGQNMVGWLSFRCSAPEGTKIRLQFGEILQQGCFYNDNLRKAKAEFNYIADGADRLVRQHFTFYGFRFVKVSGWVGKIDPNDFEGLVIHSEMDEIGHIETADPLVNQLVHNAKWGQKGNFLDVPTDCPQRDERCGWTGDAQIFSGTASFNMDTFAFYAKFGRDVWEEQKKLGGKVPDIVPLVNFKENTSTAWGDAATIIPWNVYVHSGDSQILERQFDSMKAWVDYMRGEDLKDGGRYLWMKGFHYGDWLALDGNIKGGVYGATDPNLIATAYYYYSTNIVAKAAKVLGRAEDAEKYGALAQNIRDAFIREYFTPAGNLSVPTMTAYTVVLYMGLTPDFALERVRKGLLERLKKNSFHLETGFVGTPYLCRMLSENGMNELAYHLLLEKGFPGWLYEVLMGATTIWERWNSVLPDGSISGTAMNSLNHYSYGSILEWMYREMVGIQPDEEKTGFKRFTIAPKPHVSIKWAKCALDSASGRIESAWEIRENKLCLSFTVPFDTQAKLVLPNASQDAVKAPESAISVSCENGDMIIEVGAGSYSFAYEAPEICRTVYSIDSSMQDLLAYAPARRIIEEEYYSVVKSRPFEDELFTLRELMCGPFTNVPYEEQERIDALLRKV